MKAALSLPTVPYWLCSSLGSCQSIPAKVVLDGPAFDFNQTYGFQTIVNGMVLSVPGPVNRLYLVSPDGSKHEKIMLKNRVLSIDVDVSQVKCGYNAAFYFSNMNLSAPIGKHYCDAQGTCNEMDVMEANVAASQLASHSCVDASGKTCDHFGCVASTRRSQPSAVDLTKPFTLTTVFRTSNGKDSGTLSRVEQGYSQGGTTRWMAPLDESYCAAAGNPYWETTGKLAAMSRALDEGMTMVFSLWGDGTDSMSWLDGGLGNPDCKKAAAGTNQVVFSNIRISEMASA
ncbi:hypothetical protein HDV03_001520 [Kappamyces sp. JEL0829]|nr:hypothetical protein HDV03_001520 [Kappamyces sp. JEL0829]